MMKRIGLAFLISLAAASAGAQPRPLTTTITCREAIALIARFGALVMNTGRFTYVRAVRDRSFCQVTETTRPIWVPTLDTPQCPVGHECVEAEPWRDY
jgi:hypothetical protein